MKSNKVRKVVKRVVIDFFMVGALITTLFPIFWMVFTSLKSNNDILVGHMGFTRKANSISTIVKAGDKIHFGSEDGFIGQVNSDNTIKSIFDVRKYRGMSAVQKDGNILFSHSYGVSSIDPFTDKQKLLVDYENVPWKYRHNIRSTKIVSVNGKFYVGKVLVKTESEEETSYKGAEGFEGLQVFNESMRAIGSLDTADNLLSTTIYDMQSDGQYLWIAQPGGVSVLDPATDKVIAQYTEEDGLTVESIKSISIVGKLVYVAGLNKVFKIDFEADKVTALLLPPVIPQINAIVADSENVFIGSSNGFYVFDLKNDQILTKYRDQDVYWNIRSMRIDGNDIWIGTDNGTVIKLDKSDDYQVGFRAQIRTGAYDIRWENYLDMWENISFGTYLKNSILICSITVLFSLALSTMAGYALSRFRFPGSVLFSTSILSVNMIPMLLFLIPVYLMFIKIYDVTGIQFIGTYAGIVFVYSTFFVPMSIWILRSFFVSIPIDIEEAARIDGCSRWGVFWRIALPLAAPGIIATGIYLFLVAWDELMFATILLPQENSFTIPLGIKLFIGNHQNRFDLIMAASTVATLPVLILFFLVQKWFIKGLTAGAVKG